MIAFRHSLLKVHRLLLVASLVIASTVLSSMLLATTETSGEGEAAIVGDDVASSRLEALARARWDAVEKSAGVEIKTSSFVNDFVLLDEVIIKRSTGVIVASSVVAEEERPHTYYVRVRAVVERTAAQRAVEAVARNTAIAIYLPVRYPDGSVRDSNPVANATAAALARAGLTVVDLATADRKGTSIGEVEAALRRNDYTTFHRLVHRFLTNVVLVGAIDFVRTARKGDDAGYASVPFDIVTAHLDYRLVAADDGGMRRILAAGSIAEKGGGNRPEQAAMRALDDMAASAAPQIAAEAREKLHAAGGRIRVSVTGVGSVASDQVVRATLQNIPWIGAVEVRSFGVYDVEYPEHALYLAASLNNKPGFRVTDVGSESVTARYAEADHL